MNCPKCNYPNDDKNKFCLNCGFKFKNRKASYSMISIIFGIIGFLLSFIVIGIIPAIVSIVIGIIAIATNKPKKGMAITGVVLSAISIIIFIIIMGSATYIAFTTDPDEKVYEETKKEDQEEEKQKETKKIEKNNEENVQKNESDSKKNDTKEEKNNKSKFVIDLEKYLDADVAEQANDILINKIGFSNVEFDGKLDETSNYEIIVDGTYVVMTASDKVYRIFIPSSDYVFYNDGSVLLTAQEFNDSVIDSSEQSTYCIIAEEIVKSALIDPSSADFPSAVTNASDIAIEKSGDTVVVQSYVDSNNYYGQKVRTNYIVEFKVLDIDTFSYELIYANIGGEEYGTYIDI